jgi:hypothetical protein
MEQGCHFETRVGAWVRGSVGVVCYGLDHDGRNLC